MLEKISYLHFKFKVRFLFFIYFFIQQKAEKQTKLSLPQNPKVKEINMVRNVHDKC